MLDEDLHYMAERMHTTRPTETLGDYLEDLQNPIASRLLGVYVHLDVPILGKSMIFDTRHDNPNGLAPSLRGERVGDGAWPSDAEPLRPSRDDGPIPLGHSGSSCPRLAGLGIIGRGGQVEIPVEILAFHTEGHNGEVAYSVTMYSEVTGRLVLPPTPTDPAHVTMWGRMQITVVPDRPDEFGGLKRMEFVSRDYIKQEGYMRGFPPTNPGAYLESSGNEVYVSTDPALAGIEVVVRRGRIIFSIDEDDFLQARTRVTRFQVLGLGREPLDVDDPYDPALAGRIGGVRLEWGNARDPSGRVTHYNVYRVDPDDPTKADLVAERTTRLWHVDDRYDGSRSYAYAVVPAFTDSTGTEVQGVSLDLAMVLSLIPQEERLAHRNHGVGHLRRLGL